MKTDYLIVGQGLAGTLLAYRLAKAGKSICFVDAPEQTAATSVAAGIINPITGRRFVKSWIIDALIPEADTLYAELEQLLGQKFHYRLPLIRSIHSQKDQNFWDIRGGDPAYDGYLNDNPDLAPIEKFAESAFSYGGIHHSSRVEIGRLTYAYREFLQQQSTDGIHASPLALQTLRQEAFDYNQLNISEQGIKYGDLSAEHIIFCEGWRARFNPWFNYLPHRGAKGEVLLAKINAPMPSTMLKQHVFVVPQHEADHWIGATADNQFEDDQPSAEGRRRLKEKLSRVLKVPYEITDHRAAVRPTVKDRRPIIGPHPEHRRLYIFNGLGTKGTSLAPLCSRWFVDHLLTDAALPAEVNINRFTQNSTP